MMNAISTESVSERAGAAARVLLLLLSLSFFAALWESDSPVVRESWLARQARQRQQHIEPAQVEPSEVQVEASDSMTSDSVTQPSENESVAVSLVTHETTSASGASEVDRVAALLPPDIAPGSYRVVDTRGSVSLVVVPESRQKQNERLDLYAVNDGDRMIYFIRLQAAETVAVAGESSVR